MRKNAVPIVLTPWYSLQHHHGLCLRFLSVVDHSRAQDQSRGEDRPMHHDEPGHDVSFTKSFHPATTDSLQCGNCIGHSGRLEG